MWNEQDKGPGRIIVSYHTLRRVVGFLGILLPVLVAAEYFIECRCGTFRPSISDYYDVQARDLFVGILFTIAWFLFTYRGHDRRDDIAGDAACLFALGVALIPHNAPGYLWAFHFIFAAALFLTLAYFSWHLFTQSNKPQVEWTPRKHTRNRIYRWCAVIMVLCIALIGAYKAFGWTFAILGLPTVYLLETAALWAFGYSWMVKGEAWWGD